MQITLSTLYRDVIFSMPFTTFSCSDMFYFILYKTWTVGFIVLFWVTVALIAAEWMENLSTANYRVFICDDTSHCISTPLWHRMDTIKAYVSFQIAAAALCLEIYTHFSTWRNVLKPTCLNVINSCIRNAHWNVQYFIHLLSLLL